MSTNNFENAKNGIFVIEKYEELPYADWLVEQGLEDNVESKEDYEAYVENGNEDGLGIAIDDTIGNIVADLENMGYEVTRLQPDEYKVTGKSMDGQIGLRVQGGYYADAQVIITTQRDELLSETNSEDEDIVADVYDFVDEQGYSEYTEDKEDFEDDPEYHLNEVLHNQVTDSFGNYVEVPDDMLPDDKVVIDVVSQYTTPIKKVSNFSNGEALYEKA